MRGSLNDIGDPEAPVGSPEWCKYAHVGLLENKQRSESAVSTLKWGLKAFKDAKRFKQLSDRDGRSFKSWKAYVTYPEPWGLGMRDDIAHAVMNEHDEKALLKDVVTRVLHKHGGDRRSEQARTDQAGQQKEESSLKRGEMNTKAHWMARLDRDRPDLAARVRAKTISATAAAIEAGFRKKAVRKNQTPLEKIQKLWAELDSNEQENFCREHCPKPP